MILRTKNDIKDLVDLYLTKPDRSPEEHEEIKQLFDAHAADLEEIVTETKIFNDMIEDTDQFISAHLGNFKTFLKSLYCKLLFKKIMHTFLLLTLTTKAERVKYQRSLRRPPHSQKLDVYMFSTHSIENLSTSFISR